VETEGFRIYREVIQKLLQKLFEREGR
jgi:hypothetical protein